MKLFKSIKKKHEQRPKVKVPGWMVQRQKQAATHLQRKTIHWTKVQQLKALFAFALLSLMPCCWVIWNTMYGNGQNRTIYAEQISFPKIIIAEDDWRGKGIGASESQIPTLRIYLDSLLKSARGKQFKDSIEKVQPGLLDSLTKFHPLPKVLN